MTCTRSAGLEAPAFVVESETLSAAFSVARRAHSGHTRGGHGRPYFEHPIQVAEFLRDEGYDESCVRRGPIHDVSRTRASRSSM